MSAAADGVFDIFRFFNTQTGTHFYTASETERNTVQTTLPQFNFEGNLFDSNALEANTTGEIPVFRFFNTQTGTHFYTASTTERDSIIANLPQFNFEGTAYQAYSDADIERAPLYRFFNTQTGTHFYTASETERANVIANLPQFNFEGIAYYVGGINAGVQLDLSNVNATFSGNTLTANTQTTSSFKIGGGTAAPQAPASPGQTDGFSQSTPFYSVTGIDSSDYFELITTNGGVAGSAGSGNGGDANAAFRFEVGTDTSADVLNLSLKGGVTITGGSGGGATSGTGGAGSFAAFISGFETVNIASNGTTANSFAGGSGGISTNGSDGANGYALGFSSGTARLVITGTQDINLGNISHQGGLVVDGSALTGKLTVAGNPDTPVADTLIGGAGADLLEGAGAADTLTGNGGADIFQIFLGDTTTSAFDTITDWNAGGTSDFVRSANIDEVAGASINTTGLAGLIVAVSSGGKATFAAADDTFAEKLAVLDADDTNVGIQEVVFFEHGADTYIFYENTFGSGDEQLIKLTGVTGLSTLTESGSLGDFSLV
jgi:hypothetical protein